jgi:hypothetical protein
MGLRNLPKPAALQATERFHSPFFGHMVGFNFAVNYQEDVLLTWLSANVEGRHGVDYQRRNYRTSFLRAEDADLCYLAFA